MKEKREKRGKNMRRKNYVKIGAVVLALATALTGCGSADSAKNSSANEEIVAGVTSESRSEEATEAIGAEEKVDSSEDTQEAAEASASEGSATAETSTRSQTAAESFDDVAPFTVRVGVCPNTDLYYLAIVDKHIDFFKDYGITYETTEFAVGINTIDAITTGQLDIGNFADYAGVNRIGNTVSDTNLRAFVNTGNHNSSELYVNPEKIKSGEDLDKGNLISIPGVVYEYEYGKAFETYGVNPEDATIVNVSSAAEAIALAASGEGDSFWASASVKDQFAAYGWQPLVDLDGVDARMYGYLVSTSDYLESHQREVAKFLKATREGFQYIEDHQDEVAEWINQETGFDKELFKRTWQENDHNYGFDQEAYEDLVKVEKWCFENGKFDTDYDVADFIDTTSLSLAYPETVTWKRK